MLQNVNMLYLGCSVLILMDVSFISRFWTLFEAWLSMQQPTPTGLKPATEEQKRWTIVPILSASELDTRKLCDLVRNCTPQEAHKLLSATDITVTNAGDKTIQLQKLDVLDEQVKAGLLRPGQSGADQARRLEPRRHATV